jgi:hypothetical protein
MLPGLLRAVFFYQFTDPLVASTFIVEMQPLYASAFGKFLLLLLPLLAIFLLRNRRAIRAGDWLLFLLGLALLLLHSRYAPLFALTLVVPLTLTLTGLSDGAIRRSYLWTLIPVALLLMAAIFPRPSTPLDQWLNRRPLPAPSYPAAAADYLETHYPDAHGRLLTDFTTGGYLEFRFSPRFQIFVDGRTQIRPPSFWQNTYLRSPDDTAGALADAHANAAILQPTSPFLDILLHQRWQPIFADDRGILLLPPDASAH